MSDSEFSIPQQWLVREDEREDALFYAAPRLVTHIDDETIEALSGFYFERLENGSRVLDLMSSWVSHLPAGRRFTRVAGL